MLFAKIESDAGEVLNIRHPNGQFGGNPIAVFHIELTNFCSGANGVSSQWIRALDKRSNQPLCTLCIPLTTSMCDGYSVADDAAWVELTILLASVRKLLDLLKAEPLDNEWYDVQSLKDDLEALYETLNLFAKRKAKAVRIKIV
jgi:hypothetical protein